MSELDLNTLFPFELDDFQHRAIAALDAGKSVVVCVPTGSGKTLVGEYAIFRALAAKARVFYTTPLKALSNQKLRDFRIQFGEENVGLLTGDISVNREAPILVMTTEIFRNMLYGTHIGEMGISLMDVATVVLDECHFMNDRQRGTVWEESIIYCPPEIQLVALSATVANSDRLTDWIAKVHGPTELIHSDYRPVPLEYNFCNGKGLFPLLDNKQQKLNPKLKPKRRGKQRRPYEPARSFVLARLREREMLPAIYFIFSRRGCDRAVNEVGDVNLLDEGEAARVRQIVDRFLEQNPDASRGDRLEPLYRGIASHHAGILPAWKGLVEELFQRGLVKVVFATETLAAGINMPARTTVISSLSKRTDRGHRLLTSSEFLQMSGRAGRRGMDERGYVVTVQTRFEGAKEAAYLATSTADPLVSQFTPNYGMVLNLLQTHTLEEAKELVERSFGQYIASLQAKPDRDAIAHLESEANRIREQLNEANWTEVERYAKLKQRLKAEKRLFKTLKKQAEDVQASILATALPFAMTGTILSIKGKPNPKTAVLAAKIPGSGQAPYLICLTQDNRWRVLKTSSVVGLHSDFPRIEAIEQHSPPPDMAPKPGSSRKGNDETAAIAQQMSEIPLPETAPEVTAQGHRMAAVEAQLENHPALQWGDPMALLKKADRLESLEADLDAMREEVSDRTGQNWEEFLDLIAVLQQFGALEESFVPTPLGEMAAAIRGDNELWLGLALASGELDDLDPHHFAAACAALVTEVSRPDTWTRYEVSPPVQEVLEGLRKVRRQVFKIQRRHNVAVPVWLEQQLISIVEQWALGIDWMELCLNTSLDEGDLVRILRRTLDFLSQVPHVPHLSASMKRNADRAIGLLDRFPVNEEPE